MFRALIDLSIRWKLLIYVVGVALAFRLVMIMLHHYGNQQTIAAVIATLTEEPATDAGGPLPPGKIAAIEQSIKAATLRNLAREAAISVGLLLLITAISIAVANAIAGAIAHMTAIARDLARGDFSATRRLDTVRNDEVGELSRAFAGMAAELQHTQANLEQTIQEIRLAERRLNLFFEQSTDILGIADYDTRIVYANPAFLKKLGYTRMDIAGISYLDLVHPDDLERSRLAAASLREGKNLIEFENRFRGKNGSYRRIVWNIASDPGARWIYAAGRDTTEEHEYQEEVVRAAAAEQERIARDLHDSVGQLLTSIAFKAKLIERDLADGIVTEPAKAAELVALANRTGEQVRALARGIDPVELQHGLAPALEYLAFATKSTFGISCHFDHTIDETGLERSHAVHLYRIAQEAVNNAVKHSKARHIDIKLERENKTIRLSVIDNGCGLVRRPPPEGQGLRIMNYRARLIGGTLNITPMPDCGLHVQCSVKLST